MKIAEQELEKSLHLDLQKCQKQSTMIMLIKNCQSCCVYKRNE